ncbi:MAG: thioredoxin family protein [Bacteroidales bacterium]|nr:thioredoxin family protein [Bacteroidales bacterium]
MSRLLLLFTLLLQLAPQVTWKSEVKQSPEGNQIVLTGDLDQQINHVSGTVTYMPCIDEACFMPVDWDFDVYIEHNSGAGLLDPGNVSLRETPPTADGGGPLPLTKPRVATVSRVDSPDAQNTDQLPNSLWALILEAILWGFAMLLTPCVFPMVPMTVSFFMKGSENARQGRLKAALYGLFIVLLYTVPISLIIGITWIVGGSGVTADIFNWLSTHWLPNILFFLVFMVFAASFFGAFEITLPSKWTNSADKNSDRKGLGGIFFLALTLVLVSFSCTGPIVGTVLIKSTQGEFWTPMVTMLAFSIAFALPFTVLALFPSLLKKLPKSGGWLNSVKVVLGFIEIALGLKFLSTADQTYHWHLLDREVYLAIWIAVFTLLGLYLIGKIRFKHDSPLEYLSVTRLTLAIAVFAFVVYLIPGMWGAPLKALSGYMPPMETQDFVLGGAPTVLRQAQEPSANDDGTITIAHGLQAYDNLPDGLAAAKAAGKPVFLDFTGYGCVNCREMEARVWSDPEVLRRLRDDFVIVALHVDDKTKLPESQWVTNDRGQQLKDVGRVNSYIALHDFGVNAQPNYFLLDSDGNRLAGPRPYNLDIQGFISFLDSAF